MPAFENQLKLLSQDLIVKATPTAEMETQYTSVPNTQPTEMLPTAGQQAERMEYMNLLRILDK